MFCRRKKSNCFGFSSQSPSRDKCNCLSFYFWMSFSPLISSARFKWRLMSQFMHHRQPIFIAAGTRLCWGVMVDFLFVFWGGGGISYLKDKGSVMEQPNSSLRRMAAGSLWKDRLTLPPFPFFSSSSPPPPPSTSLAFSSSHLHSNRFLCVSHPVCFSVCPSLNPDFLSWFLIQQRGSNRKGKGVMRRCIHTTTRRAFSLCCHEWHKKTASIHLNVGFYSYCWCPYPQDTRQW